MYHVAGDPWMCVCLDYCHSKAVVTNKENRIQNQSVNSKIQKPCGTTISGDLLNIFSGLGILRTLSEFMLTFPWGERLGFPQEECFT